MSNKKHIQNRLIPIVGVLLLTASVFGSLLSGSVTKIAHAATGDTATVVMGRTETGTTVGSTVDISICVQSGSGAFKLADTSTWLGFDNAVLSTAPASLVTKGKFDGAATFANGYDDLAYQRVTQTAGFTTDLFSLRTTFVGDGVTAGQTGLTVSTTRPELIGKVRFTKTVSGVGVISLNSTVYTSLDYNGGPMALTTVQVPYDCNTKPIAQTNVSSSTNCINTLAVTVPNTYTCNFPLTGNPDNLYIIDPTAGANPIVAYTGTDNSTTAILTGTGSNNCTVINNGTASAALTCVNIGTTNAAAAGVVNVIMKVGTGTATTVGAVNLLFGNSTLILKALLTGDYDSVATAAAAGASRMATTLNTIGVIPTAQPYSASPWNYAGAETIGGAISANVADWVLVEIRNAADTVVIERKAALLMKDGTIVNSTAQSGAVVLTTITSTGNYNVIIRHRNHVAISTATTIVMSSGSANSIDFTTNLNVQGGNQTLLGNGSYALKAGNTNGDNAIDASDRVATRTGTEAYRQYDKRDLNMDGTVDATDRQTVRIAPDTSGI